jgi:cellulose biosynthesis protein BcsQ
MYDPRATLTNDVSMQLRSISATRCTRTLMPRNVRLAEAPSHGVPAMYYDKPRVAPRRTWRWPAKCSGAGNNPPSQQPSTRLPAN